MFSFKSKFAILAIILLVYSVTDKVGATKSHFMRTKGYQYPIDSADLYHLNTYVFTSDLDFDFVTGLRTTKLVSAHNFNIF